MKWGKSFILDEEAKVLSISQDGNRQACRSSVIRQSANRTSTPQEAKLVCVEFTSVSWLSFLSPETNNVPAIQLQTSRAEARRRLAERDEPKVISRGKNPKLWGAFKFA